jgi:hypothetical protein
MSKLYVNAPVQNTEFDPEIKLGKIIPMFVAGALQTEHGPVEDRVELWNNVLGSEQAGYTPESYEQTARSRLAEKYESPVMSWLARTSGRAAVLTDSNPNFTSWAAAKVEQSLSDGDMRIESIAAFICSACDATIAAAEGPEPSCITCPDAHTAIEERSALVASITDKSVEAALAMVDTQLDPTLPNQASHVPRGTVTLNKRRLTGISLETAGFPEDVLDPRIGLGLLAIYAAEKSGRDSVAMVAARTNQFHNLPQFAAAIGSQLAVLPALRMVGIAKAPIGYLEYIVEEGVLGRDAMYEAVLRKLAPKLPAIRRDMSPRTAESLIFSKKIRK